MFKISKFKLQYNFSYNFKFKKYILNRPKLSTYIAAALLAACWVVAWLSVFFISTWVLSFETSALAFIMALWMSVSAETIIRSAENSDFIACFSKPHEKGAKGENNDYKGWYPIFLLFGQLLTIAMYGFLAQKIPDWFGIQDYTFVGQANDNSFGFLEMVSNWYEGLLNRSIAIAVAASFIMRVIIYKRSHKNIPQPIGG